MIDNFDQIQKLLNFTDEYDFYELSILRRGKDHPELVAKNYMFKTYYIDSLAYFLHIKDEVIKICDMFGCRAYFYPSKKNFKKVVPTLVMESARRMRENDYKKPFRLFGHSVGITKSSDPIWVVDYDFPNSTPIEDVVTYIETECRPYKKIVDIVPTKHGYHILTHPFNSAQFKEKYKDIEIKDNNPTILYIGDNI